MRNYSTHTHIQTLTHTSFSFVRLKYAARKTTSFRGHGHGHYTMCMCSIVQNYLWFHSWWTWWSCIALRSECLHVGIKSNRWAAQFLCSRGKHSNVLNVCVFFFIFSQTSCPGLYPVYRCWFNPFMDGTKNARVNMPFEAPSLTTKYNVLCERGILHTRTKCSKA